MLKTRSFEPTTPGMNVLGTENRRFEIPSLSALSPLLEPRDILGRMLPGAPLTDRHAIYVTETDARPLYIPALLLIERLWLWSPEALRAILTPNSLDMFLGTTRTRDNHAEILIDPQLASRTPTDIALRRIAWLAQSAQARASWNSVLTNAHGGRINLMLPAARLSGWMWGVELPAGFLVCELLSHELTFDLTGAPRHIRIGSTLHGLPTGSLTTKGRGDVRPALRRYQS